MSDNEYVLTEDAAKKAGIIEAVLQEASQDQKLRSKLLIAIEQDPRGAVSAISDDSIRIGDISDRTLSRLLLPIEFYLQNETKDPMTDLISRIAISDVAVGILDPDPFVTTPRERPPDRPTDRQGADNPICDALLKQLMDAVRDLNKTIIQLAACYQDAAGAAGRRPPRPGRDDLFGADMLEGHSYRPSLEMACQYKVQALWDARLNLLFIASDVEENC